MNDAPESVGFQDDLGHGLGGSRRVRSGAEPMDQESAAVISRHSPRSADPGWDNLGSWTPPPVDWMPAGDACGKGGRRLKSDRH
jgi:hypothetical protein